MTSRIDRLEKIGLRNFLQKDSQGCYPATIALSLTALGRATTYDEIDRKTNIFSKTTEGYFRRRDAVTSFACMHARLELVTPKALKTQCLSILAPTPPTFEEYLADIRRNSGSHYHHMVRNSISDKVYKAVVDSQRKLWQEHKGKLRYTFPERVDGTDIVKALHRGVVIVTLNNGSGDLRSHAIACIEAHGNDVATFDPYLWPGQKQPKIGSLHKSVLEDRLQTGTGMTVVTR